MTKCANLQTFGYLTHIHIQKHQQNKFEVRCERGVLVGYDKSMKVYRIWLRQKQIVIVSQDVNFYETRFYRSDPSETTFEVQPLMESWPLLSLIEDLPLLGTTH